MQGREGNLRGFAVEVTEETPRQLRCGDAALSWKGLIHLVRVYSGQGRPERDKEGVECWGDTENAPRPSCWQCFRLRVLVLGAFIIDVVVAAGRCPEVRVKGRIVCAQPLRAGVEEPCH